MAELFQYGRLFLERTREEMPDGKGGFWYESRVYTDARRSNPKGLSISET